MAMDKVYLFHPHMQEHLALVWLGLVGEQIPYYLMRYAVQAVKRNSWTVHMTRSLPTVLTMKMLQSAAAQVINQ